MRKSYDNLYREAIELKHQASQELGIQMIATSAISGKQIVITDITKYNHPNAKSENLNIKARLVIASVMAFVCVIDNIR
jgi:hypothetical protein